MEEGVFKVGYQYLKIIKVKPINYNLKSEIEKEAILNSYKLFLKTCDFDLQILIQSKKENIANHIERVKQMIEKEEKEKIKKISEKYINFIKKINSEKKFLTKVFYIIIKEDKKNNEELLFSEERMRENLKEKYLKIKECLARCGNYVEEIEEKKELVQIFNSFFYAKNELNQLQKEEE